MKISELIKILKGEGNVAAVRRAERIGDEAPYAAERIDAETLRSALSRGDNAASLAIIRPEDFRYLAAELPAEYLSSSCAEKISAPAGMSVKEYIRHLGGVAQQKGFEDIPFLDYGEHLGTSRLGVTGHEGRHRMRALEGLGDEKALVRLLPRFSLRESLPRRSRSEFLDALAEKYGIPLRLDPEGYESIMNDMSRPVEPFGKGSLVKGKKLSERAREGLTEYQSGLYNSKVGGYSTLQNYLRTGGTKKYGTDYDEETLKKIVEGIDEAFIESRLAGGTKLYRGLNDARALFGENLENLQVGKVLNDPGFLSTTKSKKIAQEKFSKKLNPGERPYILEIDVPSDMPGFDMSQFKDIGEQEVLLPRNLPLEITDIRGGTIKVRPVVDQKMHGGMVQSFSGGGLAKFFSAVDEAVANLRQKKGTGEQMLKQIQQSPGVKKEELELRQIPQKLAGQQKVTQEDIQAMIKAVPAPKLQMTERGGKGRPPVLPDFDEWLNINEERKKAVKKIKKAGFEPVQNPDDPAVIGFMEEATGDILDFGDARRVLVNQRKDVRDMHGDLYRKLRELEEDVDIDAMSAAQKAAHMDEVARVRDELEDVTAIIRSYDDATDWLEVIDVDWEAVASPKVLNPKFEGFTAEGPKENYRELLIQLQREPKKTATLPQFDYNRQGLGGDPEVVSPREAVRRLGLIDVDDVGYDAESVLFYPSGAYIVKRRDGKFYAENVGDEVIKNDLGEVESWLAAQLEASLRPLAGTQVTLPEFQGRPFVHLAHFPEEDIVVHARVDDRVGPNGEKILFVEEIQSDWHQEAKGNRTAEARRLAESGPIKDQIAEEARRQVKTKLGLDPEADFPLFMPIPTADAEKQVERMVKKLEKEKIKEIEKSLPKDFGYERMRTRVPPWQQTSHELAVKQILDTAANEGYDKVMFAPASEQVRRYSLGTYVDEMSVEKNSARGYTVKAKKKDGTTVTQKAASEKELRDLIGTDMVDNVLTQFDTGATKAKFEGEDLLMGGDRAQGKRKIYDEIIPQYLSKYAGKEFNVQPGRSSIQTDSRSLEQRKLDYRNEQFDKRRAELLRRFEEGDLDDVLDADLRGELFESAMHSLQSQLTQKGKFFEDFIREFAPPETSGAQAYKAVKDMLDPSSFHQVNYIGSESGRPIFDEFRGHQVKFKDPVQQAKYEEWLEDAIIEKASEPRFAQRSLDSQFRRLATEELDLLGEALYADMPQPKRLEGVSIDITPEMSEKIRTRGQPLFAVPPAVGIGAAVQEEEPVQEFAEAGRVEKKKGMQQEQFESPFDERRRIGAAPGLGTKPAAIRDLSRILRGEDSEAKNLERQRIAGNVAAGRGLGEYMYDMLVPQAWWEFPLEAAFLPVSRPVRKGMLAAAAALYDPEAEPAKIPLLHGSPGKIKDLEKGRDMWMTTDPEYALKRAMDKMRIMPGVQGPGVVNRFQMEDTDLMRLIDKYSPEEIALARKTFAKLPEGRGMTGEEIYEIASTNTGGAKNKALENVTRALGKKGYQVPPGATDKGEWYRVLDQTDLEPYGKGGRVIDEIKKALKVSDAPPDPSRRKAIGLREKIAEPGALTTVETEVSASDMDTLQKALGNVGQAILNEPVSRREVLKRGALTAASNLIPGGGVLQQLAKEAVPQAVKAATGMPSNEALTAMLAKSIGQRVAKIPEADLDDVMDTYPMIQELEPIAYFGDLRYDEDALDSLYGAIGLRTQTLAEELKIPQEKLYELFGTRKVDKKDVPIYSIEELIQPFGDMSEQYRFILEDGRPKEAVRDTSLLDNWNKWAREAIKETLTENRDDELEFVQQVQEKMFDRFLSEELANAGLSTGKLRNPMIDALAEELHVKEKAREVFNLALGDKYISSWGSELNNRAIEAFNSGKLGRFTTSFDFDD